MLIKYIIRNVIKVNGIIENISYGMLNEIKL